jgi:hypothetical protein
MSEVAPVQSSYPSTEEVQRVLHGRHYDAIKKQEKELADKAPKQEDRPPYPSTEQVMAFIDAAGRADTLNPDLVDPAVKAKEKAKAAAPTASTEQKAAEAEPMRASYRTRASKPE